jgi:uncharacterized glyoxalase superfamily protein PhnB
MGNATRKLPFGAKASLRNDGYRRLQAIAAPGHFRSRARDRFWHDSWGQLVDTLSLLWRRIKVEGP